MNAKAGLILIGVDGGATRVRAHDVLVDRSPSGLAFRLGDHHAVRAYPPTDFRPLPLNQQWEEQTIDRVKPIPCEVRRGRTIAATIVECVTQVVRAAGADASGHVRLGLGMPGLKTPDGRGIAVMKNGPRMPQLGEWVEAGLRREGVTLAEPLRRIGSDADYCGLGEECSTEGLLRDVADAYYLGGGTGLTEALKLRGGLLPLDGAREWLAKAWQMKSIQGPTFEELASASGLNVRSRELRANRSRANGELPPTDPAGPSATRTLEDPDDSFPEVLALRGDAAAAEALDAAAGALAELIFERMETLYRGRGTGVDRGATYAALAPGHPYRETLLDRIVLGQQIGRIAGDERYARVFGDKLRGCLTAFILADGDRRLRDHYAPTGRLRPGLLVSSRLPAAAAIGAAVDAQRPATGPGLLTVRTAS